MTHAYWIAFGIYFILLFIVAVSFRKKQATSSDLLVGGRNLNFWVTALSAQASDMSSWLFMAYPMSIFIGGLPNVWIAISLVAGMFCTWQFVSPKLRAITETYDAYTLAAYFAKRYGDPKGHIRIISASLMLLFITYYLSSGLISIGFLFGSLFDVNYMVGIVTATVIVMAYTFIGGYVSVAWADLFQALFLLAAILVVPILSIMELGSFEAIFTIAQQKNIPMNIFSSNGDFSLRTIFYPLFGWGLGYFGMPHILIKFMGIKNTADLKKSKWVGITWQILALMSATFVGLIAIAYFQHGITNPELVFVEMVKDLFSPFVAGLILCGVLAATISTMDSQILVLASILTEDIYKFLLAPKLKNQNEIAVFRFSVIIMSLIALWIASGQNQTIMQTVYYAWSGLGCTFGPLLLCSLYSEKPTYHGAIAGLVTGGVAAALWPTLNLALTHAFQIDEIPSMIIGFPLSLFAIFYVSAKTKNANAK